MLVALRCGSWDSPGGQSGWLEASLAECTAPKNVVVCTGQPVLLLNKRVPQFPHLLPALQTQMQMQLKSKCILSAGIFAFQDMW